MIRSLALLLATMTPTTVAAEQSAVTMERVTVSQDDAATHAFPSLARLGDGRLLCVYSTVDAASGLLSVGGTFSDDHGRTWATPVTLLASGDTSYYDPAVVVIGRRVIVTSTAIPASHGNFIIASSTVALTSNDNAGSWLEPYTVPMPYRYTSGKVNNGIVLRDGSVLFGYTWEKNLETIERLHSEGEMEEVNAVMISQDHGATWQAGGSIGLDERRPDNLPDAINGLCEPALLERADGSIYMLSRTGLDRLYQSISTDSGKTWSSAEPTDLVSHNSPAALCEFSGDIGTGWLVAWNHSRSHRWPLSVAASFDEGRTWTLPFEIARHDGFQSSYPACVQAADGALVVVYQQDRPGKGRQIAGVRLSADAFKTVAPAPVPNTSTMPVERMEASSRQRHADIVARMVSADPDLVFIGDSITQRWESAGIATWNEFYADRNAFNMGRDGDGTQTLLWRLNNSPLHRWSPQVAVVLIGTANWTDSRQTPEMVASGIAAVAAKLRLQWPETRIVLLSIFPRYDYESATWERRQAITEIVAKLADGQKIVQLDLSDTFTAPDRSWLKDIMPDKVHLSADGYRRWAEAMEPTLRSLMQPAQ